MVADESKVETASQSACVPGRNGGRLLPGGKPGNRGGGRLPSRVRALALQGIRQTLPEIYAIAKGTKSGVRPADQVQAWRAMANVALSRTISSAELQARLIEQVQATRQWARQHGISQELLDGLFDAQESAWR